MNDDEFIRFVQVVSGTITLSTNQFYKLINSINYKK